MSGPDSSNPDPDDPVIRAGEYALGLLEGEERAAEQREMLAGGEFADAVAWWEMQFARIAEEAGEVAPSPRVWPAILARIDERGEASDAPAEIVQRPDGLAGWRLGTALAGAAAVAAAMALFFAPTTLPTGPLPPSTVESAPQLIAQLQSEDGAIALATRFDPAGETLNVRATGLTPDNPEAKAAELWVVPEGGDPVSLGLISGDGQSSQNLDPNTRQLLKEGATLAVTIEERQTAPHDAPTTPILIAGQLTQL